MEFEKFVKGYDNFPKEGVKYWDFTYLLKNVKARNKAINKILEFLKDKKITKIVAIESKGFTIGSIIAHLLNLPLVLMRKPNLIPGDYYSEKFIKEYGEAEYQLKTDALIENDNCAIIYDIMAGSGASLAAINLVKKQKAKVNALVYITELEYLYGRKDLKEYDIFSLVKVKEK